LNYIARHTYGDLYSKTSLHLLLEYPTSQDVLKTGEDELTEKIETSCTCRSYRWARERAKKLQAAAARNP
jgi:transposase